MANPKPPPSPPVLIPADIHAYFNAAPDAMLVVDQQGCVILINRQAEDLFGYSRSELIGQSVEFLIPERYRGQHSRRRMNFFAASRVRPMGSGLELFGLRKDGSEFPAEISLSPLATESGTVVISAIRDVTERKLAEAQIAKLNDELEQSPLRKRTQKATARLAAVVAGSEDAIIGWGLDGIITDWNQAATRLYGYTAEEAIGRNVSMIVPSVRANELIEVLNTVAAGQRIRQLETVRQNKEGGLVYVSLSVAPITGHDGTVVGGSSITRDIARRKRMEDALRRSEERFRLVALATKDILWDWEGGRIWRSESFWKNLGYPPRESEPDMAGWIDLLHPEDRDRVWNGFRTALARHSDSYEVEYRVRRANNSYAVVLDRAHIVYDETEKPTRVIGAITDLSDRRELEAQFMQAQKMEAVGRLAGGVAHDFNNLLLVIATYTEIIREQLSLDDKLRNNVDQVLTATGRAADLTQQLLAFSRKQVLCPHVIDLNVVVEDGVKMVKRLIGKDIELIISLGKPLRPVNADPGQIVQVLMNLCINARDAMPDGGELAIKTESVSVDVEAARMRPALVPGNYAALVVNDTGTGMTPEVQEHIFDPFFTTKEVGKGTGLGLSTVFGIVKQSGGYVWVDSTVGQGTSFTIYLPAVDGSAMASATSEIGEVEGHGEVILLAEDEELLRKSISEFLVMHGYKVLAASTGDQALLIAKQHADSIQVLITDMMLPQMGGEKLAREVAKACPQVAVLYMSGYSEREFTEYDPATSGEAFLQKPFTLQAFLQKLREMTTRRRS